jgi:uncharacterized repeat protein (TIGR01451 family)
MGALAPATAQTTASTGARLTMTQRNVSAAAETPGGTPRTDARPGDVIRYTITLTNPYPRAVHVAYITDAVPGGMRFVPGSTHASRADARLEFSIDSGKTWGTEPSETVIANGRQVDRPVSPARYTHLRWLLTKPLAGKETVTAEFSARVLGP